MIEMTGAQLRDLNALRGEVRDTCVTALAEALGDYPGHPAEVLIAVITMHFACIADALVLAGAKCGEDQAAILADFVREHAVDDISARVQDTYDWLTAPAKNPEPLN